MEDIDEDKSCLDDLKSHFKHFSPDVIEMIYETNNKDFSKTINALIEISKDNEQNFNNNNNNNIDNENLGIKEDIEYNNNKIIINNNIEDNEEDEESDFHPIYDDKENKKENKEIDNKKDNKDNNEIETDDDNILKFLIEIAPFNTAEEIKEKILQFNNDLDRVISSLLDNIQQSQNKIEQKVDDNKFNDIKRFYDSFYKDNNYIQDKRNRRTVKKRDREKKDKKIRGKYNDYLISEFLEANKNNHRIDLHGFKLSESLIIVKKKLEEMEEIVKKTKKQQLLIIVTGRGNHSPGNKPVLRPNILRWLKSKNYNVNERDPGALYVTVV